MFKIVNYILLSFTTKDEGASARKLTSFWFIVLSSWVNFTFCNKDNCIEFFTIDIVVSLILLNAVTMEQLIKLMLLKNNKKDDEHTNTQS